MFSIIAAIGKEGELGRENGLCFRIREDMKFFRDTTMNHKIVMGHKTWDSLPGKLPGRENIVISRHDFDGPDLIIHDINEFIERYKDADEEIFVIGGGTVYLQFLPYAESLYLTEVDATDPRATTFFPEFNRSKYSREIIKKSQENGLEFTISKYRRIE